MRANNLLPIKALTPNKALIITQGEEYISEAVKLAGELRNADVAVDVMYRQCKFKKKMEYANKISVPYLIIIGEEEINTKKYALKNMTSGEQSNLSIDELIKTLA